MNLVRLIQICGVPGFTLLAVLSVILTVFAAYLTFKVKQQILLTAFLPICVLPLFAGATLTLVRMLSTIEFQFANAEEEIRAPALLLAINLIPLLLGAAASFLPVTVAVLGRWGIAWRQSGLRILPERSHQDEDDNEVSVDDLTNRDANDYLDKLVRQR